MGGKTKGPRGKSETRRKGRVVSVRATPEECAEFHAAATAAGLTISSHIRESHLRLIRQTQSRRRPRVDVAAITESARLLRNLCNNMNQLARAANAGRWNETPLLEETLLGGRQLLEDMRRHLGV